MLEQYQNSVLTFANRFYFTEIRAYNRSRRSQLRSHPKFYAVDPLLARESGFFAGNTEYWILENHVANELLRRGYELFYWKSAKGYEVDFIARDKKGQLSAIQVALSFDSEKTVERELR